MENKKKIATRESYGNALVELGKKHENLVVLDADLAEATKRQCLRRNFLNAISTAELQSAI